MSRRLVVAGLIWLLVALSLEVGSVAGSDASILFGWLRLVWTAPFSIAYHVWIYDAAKEAVGRSDALMLGAVFEVVLSFLFWFVVLPIVWRKSRVLTKSRSA